MRMIFGVVMLLVVLAIVGTVGKKQLEAIGGVSTRVRTLAPEQNATPGGPRDSSIVAVPGGMPGGAPAQGEGTVPYQAKQIQQNFMDATNRALQQGPDRTRRAEP